MAMISNAFLNGGAVRQCDSLAHRSLGDGVRGVREFAARVRPEFDWSLRRSILSVNFTLTNCQSSLEMSPVFT
jgi:hypothetical protein